ncbi:type II secretion system major pseudopilin GspG [uncultured Maricaulis sp.]|uniref:type II secretion system major pseudopilin GspG n=1 Tax=uncultured Maricaulis sp. TaxID=174710 RepID=UPI0030DA1752|tara:strand:+ start:86933 stop:87409 length:477 start_codon:yes stop_codon:yes gene_type:complete
MDNKKAEATRPAGCSINDERGFTLTEMLVVLVIIALLMAILAPNIIGRLGGARSQSAEIQMENLAGALELYLIDTGRYPTQDIGLSALDTAPAGITGWSGPYLRRGGVPDDPWGNAYIYQTRASDHFTLRSLGRDGEEGGTGEDADLIVTTTLPDQDS